MADEHRTDPAAGLAPAADPAPAPTPAPGAEPAPASAPAAEAPKTDSFVEPLLTEGDSEPAAEPEPKSLEDALAGDDKKDDKERDERGRFKPKDDETAKEESKPEDKKTDAPKEDAKDKPADPAKDDEPKDDKADEPPKEVPYEVKLPEGLTAESLDKPTFEKFVSAVKDGGLKAEKATEILAMHQAELQKAAQGFDKSLRDQITAFQKNWRDETLADEELGGNRINTTVNNLRQLITRYGGNKEQQSALYKDLKDTGMGVNLRLTRFLHNIFKDVMKEGGATPPGNQPGAQAGSRDLGDVLFG
jgi:hypothetical protein